MFIYVFVYVYILKRFNQANLHVHREPNYTIQDDMFQNCWVIY